MAKTSDGVQNILIVGVGGQGIILASEILAEVAMKSGFDVKKSEVHGMAQRGGIVSSHVRFGTQVHSPLIPLGEVGLLLSFELGETLRWLGFLSSEGQVIANCQKLIPPMVSTGLAQYPENIEETLRNRTHNPILVDAAEHASDLGNVRLVNTILLGITSKILALPMRTWKLVVGERVPPALKELNLKALERGHGLA
tara:strand:+ start:122 stop:712 length:591 start_codon:yes stop_codon:yes gene_type:complete